MQINPYTLIKYQIGLLLRMLVFKTFRSPWFSPVTFTTSMCVFTKGSCPNRKYWGIQLFGSS